jgi:hypothetical protein
MSYSSRGKLHIFSYSRYVIFNKKLPSYRPRTGSVGVRRSRSTGTFAFRKSCIFLLLDVNKGGRARNFKNVAPQKQNLICKPRAQNAKCNCTFQLFKGQCAATINAKKASFHKKFVKRNFFL